MMRLLFDTNVILDAFFERDYDYKPSQQLMRYAAAGDIKAYLSAKQITDIYYSLRKYYSEESKRRDVIKIILKIFEILPTTKSDINYCLNSEMADLEDALLDEVCSVNCINGLVTNNIKDFNKAKSVIFSPNDVLSLIGASK